MTITNFSRISIFMLVLLSALALIGCGDRSLKALDPDESLVAYVCSKGYSLSNICVTNIDGSAWKYFEVDDREFTGAEWVDISNSGLVIFGCHAREYQMCELSIQDSEMKKFEVETKEKAGSQEHGQSEIVFRCSLYESVSVIDEHELCTAKFGGSQITRVGVGGVAARINNDGWIAYLCGTDSESLCAVRSDGTEQRVVVGDRRVTKFRLNNEGLLVHTCDRELCISHVTGSTTRVIDQDFYEQNREWHIPPLDVYRELRDFAINDSGEIVLLFMRGTSYLGNLDDEELEPMAEPLSQYICCINITNSGWLVYQCVFGFDRELNICSMNLDTGEVKQISVPLAKPHSRDGISVSH